MMKHWRLRAAVPSDAAAISALAVRSKAHWGYDEEFLAACRSDLTTHPAECDGVHVVVAELGSVLVGYYKLAGSPPVGELADLFVEPDSIGRAVGSRLLADAVARGRRLGYRELDIEADPHAEGFYLRRGARRAGTVPSGVIPGRLLPRLVLPTS